MPMSRTADADPVVIVAAGSVNATGSNPEESHRAAMECRSGIRELTPDDISNYDLMAQIKGLDTEEKRQKFFDSVWGKKCGAGGVIPKGYMPDFESGFYPSSFFKQGELIVGIPVVQAYVAFSQVRNQLHQLFTDEGIMRLEFASETMIDIANAAGASIEMMECEFLCFLQSEENPGHVYARSKWLLGMLGSMSAGQTASVAGIGGSQNSSNSACASSGLSMYNCFNAIKAGNADVAIVGGSEYATGPVSTNVSFDNMTKRQGALSRKWRGKRPAGEALLAFGADRDGFVPGDAAGLVVMMRQRLADTLHIEPMARVLGVTANMCRPERYKGKSLADGTITGQAALMERLLGRVGMNRATSRWKLIQFFLRKIGMDRTFRGKLIHFLHGTGTIGGGINELYAAAKSVGDLARDGRYIATGTKERNGHTLGTAFVDNLIAALQAMHHRKVPGFSATREVDPAFQEVNPAITEREGIEDISSEALRAVADSILCREHAQFDPQEDIIVVDAKGFGGTNAAMAIKAV